MLIRFCSAHAAQRSPSTALRDYQAGNFTNALAEFTRLAEVRTNDLRLIFNAGDAAYRATNYDAAQSCFQQATLSPDLKLQQQAFYNLGNVQFQKAKQAQDLDGLEQGFDAAAKIYERAVTLNTNDADAAFNLKFSQRARRSSPRDQGGAVPGQKQRRRGGAARGISHRAGNHAGPHAKI